MFDAAKTRITTQTTHARSPVKRRGVEERSSVLRIAAKNQSGTVGGPEWSFPGLLVAFFEAYVRKLQYGGGALDVSS